MSDNFRLRYDDVDKFMGPVDTDVAVEIGDLLYFDGDDVKPAASQADQGSEEANQALFASRFAGVAMQASDEGEDVPVRIATDGIFDFECPSGTWEIGELVGVCENDGGDGLLNQQVQRVSRPELAIGYVARREPVATSRIRVRLLSRTAGVLSLLRLERRQTSHVATLTGNLMLTADSPRIQVLDPGGAGREVTLPPEAACAGIDFFIHNAADAAETLTIKDDGGSTVCTPGQNETAYVFCDGTTWRGLVGANN